VTCSLQKAAQEETDDEFVCVYEQRRIEMDISTLPFDVKGTQTTREKATGGTILDKGLRFLSVNLLVITGTL